MTDRIITGQEAIDWLSCLKDIHEDDIADALGDWYKDIKNDHNEVIDMAIKALEKQIPKKPEKRINPYSKNLYALYCQHCKCRVGNGNSRLGRLSKENGDVCWNCGQAIDWSEL